MVSFAVVSLFTSIPINEVKILIFDLLSKDRNLYKPTKLTVLDIMLCLELCFNFKVFSFKNTLYRQVFGAAMGPCISPVVADIFMAYVEKTAINTFHTPPTLWVRFVDDTFCVIFQLLVSILWLWTTLYPGQKPKFWNWKPTTGNDYPSKAGI